MAADQHDRDRAYSCSFCGRAHDQVRHLITGPGNLYICEACVGACNAILARRRYQARGRLAGIRRRSATLRSPRWWGSAWFGDASHRLDERGAVFGQPLGGQRVIPADGLQPGRRAQPALRQPKHHREEIEGGDAVGSLAGALGRGDGIHPHPVAFDLGRRGAGALERAPRGETSHLWIGQHVIEPGRGECAEVSRERDRLGQLDDQTLDRRLPTLTLAVDLTVARMGYGAMQLAGPNAFGEPRDRAEALAQLRQRGLIKHLGLSGVSSAQLTEAQGIASVVAIQNLYNLVNRQDDELVARAAREHIAFVPFFPLGGFNPLQSDALSSVAIRLEASPQQVALAWLLSLSPVVIPIPGASRPESILDSVRAADLQLTDDELAAIGAA